MLQVSYYLHKNLDEKEKKKIKSHLDKKLAYFEKFFKKSDFPSSFSVEAEFSPKKKNYRAEIQLESSMGKMISSCEKKEIIDAFDEILEDLKSQFKRQKEKILTLKKRGATSIKKKFTIHRGARFKK